MFYTARSFNQPLAAWDTSSVANFSGMFEGASRYFDGSMFFFKRIYFF